MYSYRLYIYNTTMSVYAITYKRCAHPEIIKFVKIAYRLRVNDKIMVHALGLYV